MEKKIIFFIDSFQRSFNDKWFTKYFIIFRLFCSRVIFTGQIFGKSNFRAKLPVPFKILYNIIFKIKVNL